MMRDNRTYIRVHDGIVDHPKIVSLSVPARWAIVALWCYSSRHLTDGVVPDAVVKSHGRKVAAELVAAGLIESCERGWLCHDYLEHQQSASERLSLREKRAEAGARGGRAKASKVVASASGLPEGLLSKNVAELERELEKETTHVVTDTERAVLIRPSGEKNAEKQAFWRAMLTACGIDPARVNDVSRRDYQRAARALAQSQATPADMNRRAKAMRNAYSVPITPILLAKHWEEFARPGATGPTYADPYPTRTLDPETNERGLAAVREALNRKAAEA